jgi:uncharacterized cysteine cluster protein YcgN (CxxCxxCC family)
MGSLHMRWRADSSWESLCNQCGLCCYERTVTASGVRIDLRRPCPYLDATTRKCTVYDRRFRVGALCSKVNLLHAAFGRLMPLNCGYARAYRKRLRVQS